MAALDRLQRTDLLEKYTVRLALAADRNRVIERVITRFPRELSLTEGSSPRTHGLTALVLLHVGPHHADQRRPGSNDEEDADEPLSELTIG
jgi:hypothetical protein